LLAGVCETARLVSATAECPVPTDSTAPAGECLGLQWRTVRDGPFFGPYWCHGAAGVGQFLLHADRCRVAPGAGGLARQAARSVARARWAGPGVCHGLAGNLEFLLDAYRHTGDAEFLAHARALGRQLRAFLPIEPDASPRALPTGYMFGLAGILVALVRLAEPDSWPRQLAGEGLCSPSWRGHLR
jgi:hypothetical protein